MLMLYTSSPPAGDRRPALDRRRSREIAAPTGPSCMRCARPASTAAHPARAGARAAIGWSTSPTRPRPRPPDFARAAGATRTARRRGRRAEGRRGAGAAGTRRARARAVPCRACQNRRMQRVVPAARVRARARRVAPRVRGGAQTARASSRPSATSGRLRTPHSTPGSAPRAACTSSRPARSA